MRRAWSALPSSSSFTRACWTKSNAPRPRIRISNQGLARLARDWTALPEVPAPPDLDMDAHPYARDLDVFGHASVAKWLGRPATTEGARRLVAMAADAPRRRTRSGTGRRRSRTSRPKREWRETLAIEGQLTAVSPAELDRFLEWAESSDRGVPRVMHAMAFVLPAAIWILFALFFNGDTDGAWWLIPLAAGIVLSFAFARRMFAAFDRAALGERALHRYVSMLRLVCTEPWTAPGTDAAPLGDVRRAPKHRRSWRSWPASPGGPSCAAARRCSTFRSRP